MQNIFGQEFKAPKITDIVRGNKAKFSHFRNGEFHYRIDVEGACYEFRFTPEDVKGGMLLAEDSAIVFMTYINRALKDNGFQRIA